MGVRKSVAGGSWSHSRAGDAEALGKEELAHRARSSAEAGRARRHWATALGTGGRLRC